MNEVRNGLKVPGRKLSLWEGMPYLGQRWVTVIHDDETYKRALMSHIETRGLNPVSLFWVL